MSSRVRWARSLRFHRPAKEWTRVPARTTYVGAEDLQFKPAARRLGQHLPGKSGENGLAIPILGKGGTAGFSREVVTSFFANSEHHGHVLVTTAQRLKDPRALTAVPGLAEARIELSNRSPFDQFSDPAMAHFRDGLLRQS